MERTQVAIIGAGPVGLLLAILLRQRGVDVVVLERHQSLSSLPQAHVINTRTMEILREIGVEREVLAASAPPQMLRAITWCESLAGRRYGAISLIAAADPSDLASRLASSPTRISNLAQNRFEPILLQRALELDVDLRFGTTARLAGQDAHCVMLGCDGSGEKSELVADYVIACDGAGSRTRADLGIQMAGPPSIMTFMSIYFQANLDRWFDGFCGPVHWVLGSEVRGFFIGFDMKSTWALMLPYAEPHAPKDFTKGVCEGLLRKAIGSRETPFEIHSVGSWNMSAQVAETFGAGRAFLAGDSAHRFPPTGGLGMNTGAQDAHNLAWKLAAVLKGEAPPALLESYEIERKPVAEYNCAQSVANAMKMMQVEQALGTSALAPVEPTAGTTASSPVLDLGLDGDSEAAVCKRQAVAAAIAAQAEHFDYLGLDLGFRYAGPAIVGHGAPSEPCDVRRYVPSTLPGARLPHVWLRRAGQRVSTVDLAAGRFTLLAGGDAAPWAQAGRALARRLKGWLRVQQLGDQGLEDPADQWRRVLGLASSQALLVRPDGHIAWRSPLEAADPEQLLVDAIGVFRCDTA